MRSGGGTQWPVEVHRRPATRGPTSAPIGLPSTALRPLSASRVAARRACTRAWSARQRRAPRGGIFRSDDAGATWEKVNGDHAGRCAPGTTHPTADRRRQHVYVNNSPLRSWTEAGPDEPARDARRHASALIDPKGSKRMTTRLMAARRSATTEARAEQHRPNSRRRSLPCDHDNQSRNRVYGAQQDTPPSPFASRSDNGSITRQTGIPTAGRRERVHRDRSTDPNITYGGGYMGEIWRQDRRTNRERKVRWRSTTTERLGRRATCRYRFAWTFPSFSPHSQVTLYTAAQVLFRSTNAANRGRRISPISRALIAHTRRSGGPIHAT